MPNNWKWLIKSSDLIYWLKYVSYDDFLYSYDRNIFSFYEENVKDIKELWLNGSLWFFSSLQSQWLNKNIDYYNTFISPNIVLIKWWVLFFKNSVAFFTSDHLINNSKISYAYVWDDPNKNLRIWTFWSWFNRVFTDYKILDFWTARIWNEDYYLLSFLENNTFKVIKFKTLWELQEWAILFDGIYYLWSVIDNSTDKSVIFWADKSIVDLPDFWKDNYLINFFIWNYRWNLHFFYFWNNKSIPKYYVSSKSINEILFEKNDIDIFWNSFVYQFWNKDKNNDKYNNWVWPSWSDWTYTKEELEEERKIILQQYQEEKNEKILNEYSEEIIKKVPFLNDVLKPFYISFDKENFNKAKIPFLTFVNDWWKVKIDYKVLDTELKPVEDKLKISAIDNSENNIVKDFVSIFLAFIYYSFRVIIWVLAIFFLYFTNKLFKFFTSVIFWDVLENRWNWNIWSFSVLIFFYVAYWAYIASFIALFVSISPFLNIMIDFLNLIFWFLNYNFFNINIFSETISLISTYITIFIIYLTLSFLIKFWKAL